MIRKAALGLVAVVLMVALTGCTGAVLVISWSPNPIVVGPTDQEIKGTVTLTKTGGVLGSLRVDKVTVTAFDADDDVHYHKTFTLNVTIPPFVGGSRSQDVTIPVTYDDIVNEGITRVVIDVTGSDPGTMEIEIQLLQL